MMIPKHKLNESLQKEVDHQLTPLIKKFVSNFTELPRKNSPIFTPHKFEEFEDKEFYSQEEVQKKIISKYYSEKQVEDILKAIEKNLQKGFTGFISSSSIPIDTIKKSTLANRETYYHEEDLRKSVEAGVKGIFDKF